MSREARPGVVPGARDVASASLLQQGAQVTGLVVLLAVVTVLARSLSVAELGAYGLTATLAVYLLVLRASVGNSAVAAMTAARDDAERVGLFSTAAAIYAAVGVLTAAAIALAGFAIAAGVLSGELARQAKLGAAVLGLVTGVGLVATVNLDALRASLLLRRSAANEIAALLVFGALMLGLVAAGAQLWLLIAANGSIPLISGAINGASRVALALPWRLDLGEVDRARVRQIAPTAGHLLAIEVSNLVIYGLDRIVLGAFGSAATVGLYEGPVRAHNVLYALNQALGVTALPVASSYVAQSERARLRALALRGSRYSLAVAVPLTVTAMVLAGPALAAWLGERYREGETALALLVSYWLVMGQLAVTPYFLVGLGKAREVARTVVGVAALNLLLTLALTPSLGLEGPALATAISFLAGFPPLLRIALKATGVRLSELAREAWLPAYALGVALAGLLLAVRSLLDPGETLALLAALLGGPLAYWGLYFALVLRPAERRLVAEVLSRTR